MHLSAVYLGLFSSICCCSLQGVTSSQSSCLIGCFSVMDSLAIEQMAPRCTGKQLQFSQNVFVWCVCVHHSESVCTSALTVADKCLLSSLASFLNFLFTSARTFSRKHFFLKLNSRAPTHTRRKTEIPVQNSKRS